MLPPRSRRQWRTEDGRGFLTLSDTACFLLCRQGGNGDPVFDRDALRYVRDDVTQGITSLRCFLASGQTGFRESAGQWREW